MNIEEIYLILIYQYFEKPNLFQQKLKMSYFECIHGPFIVFEIFM